MLYFLGFLFIIGAALGVYLWFHLREEKHSARRRQAQRSKNEELALALSPAWQAKLAADRAYELATRKLELDSMRFQQQAWKERTLLTPGTTVLGIPATALFYTAPSARLAKVDDTMVDSTLLTELPGPYDFLQELAGWRPSPSGIFLGRNAQQAILLPASKLWHIALAGPTGGGKSTILRIILAQLLYLQAYTCYLCDINYAPIKQTENGPLDWRPIAERLAVSPIRDVKPMHELVEWLAQGELQARRDRENRGEPIGAPVFAAFDELPAVMDEDPKIAPHLMKILRQGRQYGIFFIGATQDMLVDTLKTSGAVRECFRTAYYVGGDQKTARVLLDMAARDINEEGLGDKGQVYLKTAATVAQEVRIPFASNEAITALLPPAAPGSVTSTLVSSSVLTAEFGHQKSSTGKASNPAWQARGNQIKELLKKRQKPPQIVKELWGDLKGRAYQQALDELTEHLAAIVEESEA